MMMIMTAKWWRYEENICLVASFACFSCQESVIVGKL
jgi:hypothetical protein